MRIFIIYWFVVIMSFDVEVDDKISNVRVKILDRKGIALCMQGSFWFVRSNEAAGWQSLDDRMMLCDYNVPTYSTLELRMPRGSSRIVSHERLIVSRGIREDVVEFKPQISIRFGMSPSFCRFASPWCPLHAQPVDPRWYSVGCTMEDFQNY
jgi:hypothetical protein